MGFGIFYNPPYVFLFLRKIGICIEKQQQSDAILTTVSLVPLEERENSGKIVLTSK